MGKLIVTTEGQPYGDSESLHGHDGDRADSGADGDIDKRVLVSVDGSNSVDHDGGEDRNSQTVEQEAWLQGVTEDFFDGLHVFVRRRVENDHHGT